MSVAPAPPPYDVPVPGTSDKSPVQSYDAFSAQNIPGQPMYQQQGMPVQPMYQPSINIVMQQQQQQQQQQQVTQVTTVVETHVVTYESFRAQKTLACLVLWFCNCPFGLVAYILAVTAEGTVAGDEVSAHRLGSASLGLSISGMIITILLVTILVPVLLI